MRDILSEIRDIGIIPVIKIEDVRKAQPLADALCIGNVPCAEITYRTSSCTEVIKEMKLHKPDMLVGAGTVLSVQQVKEAVEAGADFIVSPGFDEEVVEYCIQNHLFILPGCATAGEVTKAIKYRLEAVKFFPAEAAGGVPMIKNLSAPFGKIRFVPTGGITEQNLNQYLRLPSVLACGGSWFASTDLIQEGNFQEIENRCRKAVSKMLGYSLAHIGINCDNDEEAWNIAGFFQTFFGFEAKENAGAIFSDIYIENLKSSYLGKHGHIAITVNSVERAKRCLERQGISFREESAVIRADGTMQAIYLQEEPGNFAIHLVKNHNM